MSKETAIKCDVCGKKKEDANHWWSLHVNYEKGSASLEIGKLDSQNITSADVCGHQCAVQCLARFLDHGTLGEK